MRVFVLTRAVYGMDWSVEANARRLAMFRAVTVPCIAAQSFRDFEWVLCVDRADPYRARRIALARTAGVPVRVLYVSYDSESVQSRARVAANAYAAPWRDTIDSAFDATLTVRLDDDDALAPRTLRRMRNRAKLLDSYSAIIATNGIRMWNNQWEYVRHATNAMAGCFSPQGDARVVYDYSHKYVHVVVPNVVHIGGKPAWLWVRHADTLSQHRVAKRPMNDAVRAMFPGTDWDFLAKATAAQGVAIDRIPQ